MDTYLNVLFPTVGTPGPTIWLKKPQLVADLHERESTIALDVCRELWKEREQARQRPDPPGERVMVITVEHPVVGDVTARLCMDCRWAAWDYQAEHPACLDEVHPRDRARATGPPMRISPSSADLDLGECGPYYDVICPRRVMADGYGFGARTNHAAHDARRLWNQRERLRAGSRAADAPAWGHEGVVLTTRAETVDAQVWTEVIYGYAACLDCVWIEAVASSRDDPLWREQCRIRVRQHERNSRATSEEFR